ncbi:MAG: pyridoxamine 5'-phosphate oxidase family protein [Solirubrobacteraceae bacterium]|nr:pyridoxamine 5'-phosphate oxidase family protein [Solirubrobacteraceae bacterium]
MSDAEVLELLEFERTVICATIGRDGWPHLMPLWYVLRDGELWAWTYVASQKVRNLERDARATLQVETGTTYEQLRGVMIKADVQLHRDTEIVAELGLQIMTRYQQEPDRAGEIAATVAKQAPKRVALRFVERSRASWDHRKLATAQ